MSRYFYIAGFAKCRNYVRAVATAELLPKDQTSTEKWEGDRDAFHVKRVELLTEFGKDPEEHKTSPLIFECDKDGKKIKYIGGGSDFVELAQKDYGIEPVPLGPKLE